MAPETSPPLLETPRSALGVITPSGNTVVERVTIAILRLYPELSCHFSRTAVHGERDRFPDDYDWASMLGAAGLLAHANPDIICWNGSKGGSIGFDHDRRLCERIAAEHGCAATTSTLALEQLFLKKGIESFGLVTPYPPAYQQKVIATFAHEKFRCVSEACAALTDNLSFAACPPDTIRNLIRSVAAARPEAIIVWCTNFLGAPLAAEMEAETGIPVYDSTALGVWHPLKILGLDTRRAADWGSLFASE